MPSSRYRHSLGVARTGARLARRYGASPLAARLAGVLHDVARTWKADDLIRYMQAKRLPMTDLEKEVPVLLHARVGADIARHDFFVDDLELLGAIEHHTVAVPGMSNLQKIVYMADVLEPSRVLADRKDLTAAAARSLDEGFSACLKSGLQYLLKRGISLPLDAVDAYNESLSRSAHSS